ncbi:MAG TPA: PAS domain S-box protein, partial [Thermoanaerobaculia bacterium]|nr:PAS domain S-box protein [Thermoanaerobaculia bacterium]
MHVLMIVGVAVATLSGGWIAGLAAVLVPLFVVGSEHIHEAGEVLGALVDYPLLLVLALLVRNRVSALRHSELKLRTLIGSIHDAIFVLDRDGRYLEIVPTATHLLYRRPHELSGKRLDEIFPGEPAEYFLGKVRQALDEGPIDCDYRLELDGVTVWFSASISPLGESSVIWVARDITARKVAEQEAEAVRAGLEQRVDERTRDLRESKERYQRLFDQAEEIIFTLSNDGLITSINPAFERTLGWKRGEWIGRPYIDLVPYDEREQAAAIFESLDGTGSLSMSRVFCVAKNGDRIAFELSAVDQMANGMRIGFQGIARDVTQRERAEEKLRRSERQLAEAQRAAGMGSWEHDLIAGTTSWSDELFRILGVPATGDPLPWSVFVELVREDDWKTLEEAERILLSNGEHEWEMRMRTRAGEEKTVWCSGSIVSNPAHGILRVIGTLQDISERKQAEQRLEQSEERFRLVTLATSDAIWDTDLPNNRSWLSEGFQQFGYPAGWIEKSFEWWEERVHPAERERTRAGLDEAIAAGQVSWSAEYQFRRADGTYAYILDRVHIVRDASKQVVRLIGALMDLTERKQLEEQLEQAKRVSSLGRVAASIAHEFNNVLMGIQPNVEVIRRSSPRGLRHATDNIFRAVQHGKRVTDEILRFTRPAEPELGCVHVPAFVEQWKRGVEPLLGPSVRLVFEPVPDDTYVQADAAQLTQVLTNLALNARDAMQ